MNVHIKSINGHYEALVDGHFYCSGDTYSECEKEIENDNNLNGRK